MTTKGKNSPKITPVAVAVLRYGDEFLLATRHAHQHQGGKLEFVGGKIEPDETPQTALIREVSEELGLDISNNAMSELGQVYHDYEDKAVRLYVYDIILSDSQYLDFKDKKFGLDNQALLWLDKMTLLQSDERFPQANQQILMWLDSM
ncbi:MULTISPECIES: (deoxy)nucleoside triphosphate pyrophosphohydrolase [Moraxella]|uniref:8-oxo-dGTP diphosphatase n=1 Tax=Moraxella lacunata TaxID=477 RepID=A0A1B8PWR3_MORLA|nr:MULTISPECIES: (deoxy)nucleoside triphosphate pyrophosphohydrolase [Moraxella]MBE9577806.1 (deoxy)nucleoside triphosphate pyrophosphohydrolase [Moraxella sp. K1664]MBE9587228.1 (deoxy)nucleoside triphosphate pyrophosphohydrolase [Moraxella sp. K1630]MBE9589395.1 (deoxy)nucleoside triphosphate pyrophosphohydrolase [Moraxella sp. K127]MBE9595512.1 (deoxy)nucleoside triphosphate pyrophosphohydrolase [Moraxella sp. K2450]MDH9217973.1 (deoxy)nucleoside triphosphate pyrophosphohydrolase [Moraxella